MFEKIKLKFKKIINNSFCSNIKQQKEHLVIKNKSQVSQSQSIWDNSMEQYQKGNFKLYWELLSEVSKYQMKCITGDENLDYFWYSFNYLKENIGNRNLNALFLGCTEGNPGPEMSLIETGCFDKIEVMDIADGLLNKQRKLASEKGLKGIEYIKKDFNKIILDNDKYDVIWAIGSIHHIEELEHLFNQIQKSLKNNGIFITREYVGRNRLQFSENQLKIINEILKILPEKYKKQIDGTAKNIVESPDLEELIRNDPTEAVRPEDIIPLMKKMFELIQISYTGGTILHPLLNQIASNFETDKDSETVLKLLILLEKCLIEQEVLPSDYVFCMAKKRRYLFTSNEST